MRWLLSYPFVKLEKLKEKKALNKDAFPCRAYVRESLRTEGLRLSTELGKANVLLHSSWQLDFKKLAY